MKKLFVMFSMGLLMASTAFAQEAPKKDRKVRAERVGQDGVKQQAKSPEERAAKRTEMLVKKYNLTAAQQAKLQALHLRQNSELAASRPQRGTVGEAAQQQRADWKAKRTQWDAELKSIFTPEQYAQYETDRKERASHVRGKDGKKGQHLKGKGQKSAQRS